MLTDWRHMELIMNQHVQAGTQQLAQQEAINSYNKLAEHGNVEDQFNLGYLYDIGWTVPRDYTQAFKWYRKAAERGYAQAQYRLGLMYCKGQGVIQDHAEAFVWLSIAVAFGYMGATKSLGKNAARLSPRALDIAEKRAAVIYEKIQLGFQPQTGLLT